jgi:arylsulfatase A
MRRIFFLLILLGGVVRANAQDASPPNFVLIMADDQGYGDLSCYGSTTIKTPNIDRMAEEGMRLTDFYVASPICSSSRAALMTGCYPVRVGLGKGVLRPDSNRGLNPDETTVAELLQAEGYATCCIGKWHLGFLDPFIPNAQGFDYYYGLYHNQDTWEAKFFEDEGGVPLIRNGEVVGRPEPGELIELYTAEAVQFIEENKDDPFFLYLPHTMPHDPIGASERFAGRSEGGLYGDVIECLDWSTGEILDALHELGIAENTYVFYFSDNGPSPLNTGSAGPLAGLKHTTYEGGLRVPCVAWAPGRIESGSTCDQVVASIDFLPTLARLADIPLPEEGYVDGRTIDGLDVSQLFLGTSETTPRDGLYFHNGGGKLEGIREGRWKFYFRRKGQRVWELYDLSQDVGETNNVAEEHLDLCRRLHKDALTFEAALGEGIRPCGMIE